MRLPRQRKIKKNWNDDVEAVSTVVNSVSLSVKVVALAVRDTIVDNTLTQPSNYTDLENEV